MNGRIIGLSFLRELTEVDASTREILVQCRCGFVLV